MADYRNTFEGGTADANITIANSNAASGPAIAVSSVLDGWQYKTAASKPGTGGTLGAQRTLDTTGAYLRWDEPSPSGRGGCGRWIYFAGVVTGGPTILTIRGAGDEHCASVTLTNAEKFRVAPSGIGLAASDSPVATVGNWYRVELFCTPGDATHGRAEIRILEADGVTVFHTYDTGEAVDVKTVAPARFRMGGMTTTEAGAAWTYDWMDDIVFGSKASGWFPVGNAGTDQTGIEPWSTVNLVGSGVGAWTQTAGPAVDLTIEADTHLASFVAPASLTAFSPQPTFAFGEDTVVVNVLPATDAIYNGSAWVPVRLTRTV